MGQTVGSEAQRSQDERRWPRLTGMEQTETLEPDGIVKPTSSWRARAARGRMNGSEGGQRRETEEAAL